MSHLGKLLESLVSGMDEGFILHNKKEGKKRGVLTSYSSTRVCL